MISRVLNPEEKRLSQILEQPEIFKAPKAEEQEEEIEEFILNKSSQCSILCYHDFTKRKSKVRDMVIHVDDFDHQMKSIAEAGIEVISMKDFLLWKKGEKNIPDPSILITIDDGWKSVYDIAFPVLRKHRYPFTLYLYKKYVEIGGRSLSKKQILEMTENGCTIGSHSISHQDMTKKRGRNSDRYKKWLQKEIVESADYLEELVGVRPKTFSYPYGIYNQSIAKMTLDADYEVAFTVNGSKSTWNHPAGEIGRFVVHGNSVGNYKLGTTFKNRTNALTSKLLTPNEENQQINVYPAPESTIGSRLPLIKVDLSNLDQADIKDLDMSISGLGTVEPSYDKELGTIEYQVQRRLRNTPCYVQVKIKRTSEEKEEVIPWKFNLDLKSLYLDSEE